MIDATRFTLSTDRYSSNISVWCDRCQRYVVNTRTIKLIDLLDDLESHEPDCQEELY
jgi:hypothetical protein